MTRPETEPATRKQVGVIRQQFGRLDFTGDDRAERLAACAALLGLGELASTKNLTMGQAGQLYRMLLDFRDRDELGAAVAVGGEGQGGEPAREELASDGVSLADALVRVMLPAFAAWQGWRPGRSLAGEGGRARPGACTTQQDPVNGQRQHRSGKSDGLTRWSWCEWMGR